MTLTYDERSELRAAFEETYVPTQERREALRVHYRVPLDMVSWKDERAGPAVSVMLEEFSTTGVGVIYPGRLNPGDRYLLEVPGWEKRRVTLIIEVVHCTPVEAEKCRIGLKIVGVHGTHLRTVLHRRAKFLFLLFGVVGVAVAMLLL
jgi:hypothetical protein